MLGKSISLSHSSHDNKLPGLSRQVALSIRCVLENSYCRYDAVRCPEFPQCWDKRPAPDN